MQTNTGNADLVIDDDMTIHGHPEGLRQLFPTFFRKTAQFGNDVTVIIGTFDDGFFVETDSFGQTPNECTDLAETITGIIETKRWEVCVSETEAGNTRVEITGI